MFPIIHFHGSQIVAYELFAALGALIGFLIALAALSRKGLKTFQAIGLLLMMAGGFLIGARLWNIAVNPGNYLGSLTWYSFRLSGLSLYGGIIGAFVVLAFFGMLRKQALWSLLDSFVIPAGVAFCIARIGCFLNGCCAGKATTGMWGVVFPSKAGYQQAVDRLIPFVSTTVSVHPTQLYELFGAAAGIIIALWTAKRLELKEGGTFLIYVAWFSAVRLAVLPLRALTYSNEIKLIAYPMLYLLLIVGSLGLIMNRRSNELKQSKTQAR